jgi:hypothetical protein
MARLTDPRAAGFDAAAFRDAFNFATAMGAPDAVSERVTFTWDDDKTYAVADQAGRPYNWTESPATDVTHPPVVLLNVAVELGAEPEGEGTPAGTFRSGRGMMTLLDSDYEQVKDADHVHFGGRTWEMAPATPTGMFDVTVWQVPIFESSAA